MKNTTLYITTIAACGLYIAPAMAQETAAPVQETSEEVAAENTTTVYIVKFKGDGWGVTRRASSALNTQEGVRKILLSGYRATVVMEEGKALDEETARKAITGKNLSFEGFEKLTKLVPEAGYQIKVKGAGWAITNDKARVALEEMDGVVGAYVNNGITLHMAKKDTFDKDKVAEVLKQFKMEILETTPIEGELY